MLKVRRVTRKDLGHNMLTRNYTYPPNWVDLL